jgi:hypothetical protein
MRVKNINGAGNATCRCGSWLLHWARYSGRALPRCCSVRNCIERPVAGALVQIDHEGESGWYIVPLCIWHNATRNGTIDLSDHVVLVSADVAETCRKPAQRVVAMA